MLSIPGGKVKMCDGIHRREFMRIGGLGLAAGLTLPNLLKADAQPRRGPRPRANACILFFLQGGMSHIDTVDMKPNAPAGIRGEFTPRNTRIPGIQFCEHLPLLANMNDKFALIRSMTHRASNHNPGAYYALTGVPPSRDIVALATSPDDYPNPGAVINRLAPTRRPVPTFVQLSEALVGDSRLQVPGQTAGFLSAAYDPLKVIADPNSRNFNVEELSLPEAVTNQRFERRRSLLQTVEQEFPLIGELPELERMDAYYQRAYQLVTSPESRRAFDISQEPERLRDRYGRNRYGQSLLLARRLVEAGVRLITVYWGGALNAPLDYWDTHQGNFTKQRNYLLPQYDQCFSALISDLEDRGLLETTLVIGMGEFGRTPRIGQITANGGTDATGRDHWPQCYSIMLAGGGTTPGAVIGRSDQIAAYPTERPVAPEDLIATIYTAMGLDPETEVHDRLGRPLPISRGHSVDELFS